MAGLVPAIHAAGPDATPEHFPQLIDVVGRDKPGHDVAGPQTRIQHKLTLPILALQPVVTLCEQRHEGLLQAPVATLGFGAPTLDVEIP